MYKLMIVDDEAIIRRELSRSFDWEAMGFTLAGCASSGEQALEQIRNETIDIVLLDIRMPGMDGLTALDKIKEISPGTEVIILSAYDDFAYVKKGLKQGAFDYILKIDIIVELEQVFDKLKEKLDALSRDTQREKEAHSRKALTDCLMGVEPRIPFWPEKPDTRIACLTLRDRIPPIIMDYVSLDSLILLPAGGGEEKGDSFLRTLLREDYAIGISGRYVDVRSHRIMALQAMRSLDFSGVGEIIIYDDLVEKGFPERYNDRINAIKRKLLLGDDSFSGDMDTLYSLILRDPFLLYDQIKDIGHQLYYSLTELIDEDFRSDFKEDFLHRCGQLYDTNRLSLYARKTINRLFGDYVYRQRSRFSGNLLRAEKLIHSLYVTNLRLDEVARAINMSPSSFKLRFKEQTGKSFTSYLQHVRIENACDLLANTDLKIYEIADHVGYGDEKYFRKVFKQETGNTPREYRDNIGSEPDT